MSQMNDISKPQILPITMRWYFLCAGVLVTFLLAVWGFIYSNNIQELIDRVKEGDVEAAYKLDIMQKTSYTTTTLLLLLRVSAWVLVVLWFYRACQNIHLAEMNYLNYSPGWVAGWFFIPLMHIFMPIIAFKETVKATQSLNNSEKNNSWQNNSTIFSFKLWALFYIITVIGYYVFTFMAVSYTKDLTEGDKSAIVDYLEFCVKAGYFFTPIMFIEGIFLILFTKKITDLQEQYRAN